VWRGMLPIEISRQTNGIQASDVHSKKPTLLRLPLEIHPGAEEDVAALELAGFNRAQQQAHGLARLGLGAVFRLGVEKSLKMPQNPASQART